MNIRMHPNHEQNLPYRLLLNASPDIARLGLRSDFGIHARSDKELLLMSLKKIGQGSFNAEEKWFGFACILNLLRKIKLTEAERSAIYAALEKLKM